MAKGGFRGMPGGMNQAAMMKQAQKMQQEMLRMQEEMENKTYSATSGGSVSAARESTTVESETSSSSTVSIPSSSMRAGSLPTEMCHYVMSLMYTSSKLFFGVGPFAWSQVF